MRAIGEVRRLDALGRVALPGRLRRELGIFPGTPLEFLVGDGGVLALRKWMPRCTFCGGEGGTVSFRGRRVCRACAVGVARAFGALVSH